MVLTNYLKVFEEDFGQSFSEQSWTHDWFTDDDSSVPGVHQ